MKSPLSLFIFFVYSVLLLLAEAFPLYAQQVIFNPVTPPPGSFGGWVSGITQDTQGFMWFSSNNGLHRYDGYRYISYRHESLNTRSLGENWTLSVHADHSGHIWVGTFGKGLDRLDPVTGIFTHFRNNVNDSASLSADTVTCLLEDREGTIWVGTTNGLNRLDQVKGKFTRYLFNRDDTFSLSNNIIRTIYEDKEGILWIGTGNAFFIYNGKQSEGGLNRMDKKTGKFIRYIHDPQNDRSLIDNRVSAIFEDSRGVFWVGTYGDGLHTMNKTMGTFERHLYDPANPEKLSRPPLKRLYTYDDHITFITEDAAGWIWIGTLEAGINRYDPHTKIMTQHNTGTLSGLDKSSWFAYTSYEGVLWISSWEVGALYRIDPFHRNISHYVTGNYVWGFHKDASGILWVGTQHGLLQINRDNQIIKRFLHDTLDPHSISHNIVGALYEDHHGALWIGTMNGINRLDKKSNRFARFQHKSPRANSGYIYVIYEDKKGLLWLGTDEGLDVLNPKTNTFEYYRNNPNNANSLGGNFVTCIEEDRLGYLWVGTANGGINRFDPQTKKFKHYLYGVPRISGILEDSDGIVWVGTLGGLYRFNHDTDSFSLFHNPNADITTTTDINWILEDSHKNLWLSGSVGVFKLTPDRNESYIYGKGYGVTGTYLSYIGGYIAPDGEIFFGDATGYYAFFPEDLITNLKPPHIVITDFQLADQSLKTDNGDPLSTPPSQTKEIHLRYDQNVFSFDFAGIHYSSPEDNRHLYILENFDNTWRKAGEEKTAYYKVPPGQYIFRVKAANSNGIWAEKSIVVIVNRPWWNTWWFYTITTLSIIAIIYTLYRYRINQILRLQQMRTRIASDLHDDIGSTLTSISYYSELVKMQLMENDTSLKFILDNIGDNARNTISAMSDIVWIINPQNDTTTNLTNRMKRYASEVLDERNIQYTFAVNEEIEKLNLNMEQRKNLYLIYKEAVHNAVKYSQCSKIEIDFTGTDHEIRLSIKDNGKGFDILNSIEGNGLNNMKKRSEEMKAQFKISSTQSNGTYIQVTLKKRKR